MKKLLIFLLSLTSFNPISSLSLHPQVNLYQGVIRGRQMRTQNEKEFFGFLGIPYAVPPIGPLRFKQPLPHQGWSGVADARTYKDGCPQLGHRISDYGNEDCLYLNVYTLNIEKKPFAPLYPVMVFIQSDNMEKSDSSLFGPEKLLDRGVVLVTFNYRIGILGFLSTGDDSASGNWGLYDQQLVLKWIKDNIEAFLGDPNSVTLFGQGAGAAYVFFHMVSPLSQGLFHKAILQSGSGLCDWAIENDPLQYAEKIAENIHCSTSSTTSIVDCLRRASTYDLLRAENKEKTFSHFPRRAVPVVERRVKNALLPEDPRTLLARGFTNKIPVMAGINRDETAYFYPLIVSAHYRGDSAYYEKYLIPQFLESATPFKGQLKNRVIPDILFEYFNGIIPSNITNVAKRFINMSTDGLYLSCIDETIRLLVEAGYSTYMYTFEYQGQNSMIELVLNGAPKVFQTGICHGDELFYLFNLKLGRVRLPSFRDEKVSQKMLTLWTDFAKYGRAPRIENSDFPKWATFNPESSFYYEISETLEPKQFYRVNEAHFWSVHLKNISGIEPNVLAQKELRPMYKTLAWAMVGVSIGLLALIALLLAVLFYQRRTSTFRSHPTENGSSHISTDIFNGLNPWIKKSSSGFNTYSICNENVFKPASTAYFAAKFPFRNSLFPISENNVWATSFHQLENSLNLEEKA